MKSESLTTEQAETLEIFDSAAPKTTPEVADRLDLGRRSTYSRLQRLCDRGRLETKKVGANARVWWRPAVSRVRHSEVQFSTLVDAVEEYAIFTLDPDGYIRSWNRGAEQIKGYERSEILGEHFSIFYEDEDAERGVPEANLAVARDEGSLADEGWRIRADGSRFWANVTITPIRGGNGTIDGYAKVTRDMTDRRKHELHLETQADHLERQRDGLASELGEVFSRVTDAFYALDTKWRFTFVNEQAASMFDRTPAELLGEVIWDEVPGADESDLECHFREAMKRQDPIVIERHSESFNRWTQEKIYPSESGISVYFRDVTDRKEREATLELYERIVQTIDDGVYVLDEGDHFQEVNEAYCAMTGYDRDELIGSHCSMVVGEDVSADAADLAAQIAESDRDSAAIEADINRCDGSTLRAESNIAVLPEDSGSGQREIGVVRDVSDRVERERALEESERRYRTLVEHFPDGAVGLFDDESRFITIGGELLDRLELTEDDLVNSPIEDHVAPDISERVEPHFDGALAGERSSIEVTCQGRELRAHFLPVGDEDEIFSGMLVVEDVTERNEQERLLAAEREMNRQLVETSPVGITVVNEDGHLRFANDRAEEIFGRDRDEMNDMSYDDSRWREIDIDAKPIANDEQPFSRVMATGDPLFDQVSGIKDPDGDITWISVNGSPLTDEAGQITDVVFAIEDITEQFERERELERQRERLDALNDINQVVGEVTAAAVDQSTREEIEQVVCEAIASADAYEFAWLATPERNSNTFVARATAGTRGYTEEIEVTMDPDDPRSHGPGATAIREREIQVVINVFDDDRFEPWRAAAKKYGFSSVASIPIIHEDTVYGVLGVYADRDNAFQDDERNVIARLGQIVGHTISAADRKQALMSDELVELEFRINDVFDALGASVRTDEQITLDSAIPVGDGGFLVHGTAHHDALPALRGLADVLPHFEGVSVRSDGHPVSITVHLSEPPILSVVSDIGGYFENFAIENGDCAMTIHLSPTVEVRQAIEAVDGAYPSAELVRRKQIVRPRDDPHRLHRRIVDGLTDRQRMVMDAAYHGGYFEWPRETAGQEIADALGISPATFSQHLRKAEKTVFETMYGRT